LRSHARVRARAQHLFSQLPTTEPDAPPTVAKPRPFGRLADRARHRLCSAKREPMAERRGDRAAPQALTTALLQAPARMPHTIPTYHRARGLDRVRCSILATLACACSAMLAAPATAAPTSELVVQGGGWGHGVGMSQEGALGYAEHGYSYAQILAHYYSGTALGQAPANTRVRVLIGRKVHSIALETYVRGVVAAEMPSSWPAAALEAQAVAVRTYALTAHASSRFDVYADTRSQVYRGKAAYTASTDAAVAATAGQIVTYGGAPAITYFFASSGGRTESVENAFPGAAPQPWLRGVRDPYEHGELHTWATSISYAAVTKDLRGILRGRFEGIEVLTRGYSPRIVTAYVLGSAGRTLVSGAELEARLGLDSTWAYFSARSGTTVSAMPDRSGQHGAPPPAPTEVPLRPGGGVEATGEGGAPTPAPTAGKSGGTSAPAG
jgi:SpoIID/LytB domain protein